MFLRFSAAVVVLHRRIRILLANNDIDIVSINETKLDESIRDHEVHIPGYEIIRRNSLQNAVEGYASINFTTRNADLHMHALENLCLEIHEPNSKSFVILTWYRSPDSPIGIFSPFESLIGILKKVEFLFRET